MKTIMLYSALLVLACVAVTDAKAIKYDKNSVCEFEGEVLNRDESVFDGCNWCRCLNGGLACTLKYCGPDMMEPKSCVLDGKAVDNGKSAFDGCNWCRCINGGLACTKKYCEDIKKPCKVNGKTYPHGSSFKNDCNTCRCINEVPVCTLMACLDIEFR